MEQSAIKSILGSGRKLAALFSRKEEESTTAVGTVTSIDMSGYVWVKVVGAMASIPCIPEVACHVNDRVSVRIDHAAGKAYVVGNTTDPSQSRSFVAQLADSMDKKIVTYAEIANEAKEVAQATGQHFWQDDIGIYVTEATKEDWLTVGSDGFQSGYNVLINALGQLFRDGLNNLLSITRSGIAFYDGAGNDDSNITAVYGNETVIGKTGENDFNVLINANGLFLRQGDLNVAYLNNQKLYVPRTVVLDAMQLGEEGGNSWMWQLEEVDVVSLKWIG